MARSPSGAAATLRPCSLPTTLVPDVLCEVTCHAPHGLQGWIQQRPAAAPALLAKLAYYLQFLVGS